MLAYNLSKHSSLYDMETDIHAHTQFIKVNLANIHYTIHKHTIPTKYIYK